MHKNRRPFWLVITRKGAGFSFAFGPERPMVAAQGRVRRYSAYTDVMFRYSSRHRPLSYTFCAVSSPRYRTCHGSYI